MIAAKLPDQRLRSLKICKRFRYNWRKKERNTDAKWYDRSLPATRREWQELLRSAVDFNLRAMFVRENQADDATPGLVRVARCSLQSGRSVLDISTIAIVFSEQIAEKIALTLTLFANS